MKNKVSHTSSNISNSCSFQRYRLSFRNLYSILLTEALWSHTNLQNMLHNGTTPTDSNVEEEAAEGEEHLVVRGGEPRVHPGHVSGLPGVGIQCTRGGGLQLQQEQRGQNVRF